ncbi:hypothetical protein pdam_00008495 [Pocillopora damicornis]|uniref:Uncharacterized protein n=1 Tax=Pocillopora damicornis TaxID=46731 RepID=A0A3M6U4A8_POCDA|nr:hypothetical protein pdam_00008495 [Pocillopora damicornis]
MPNRRIPLSSSHVNHPVGDSSTIGQYVDKRVVDKIYDLVKQNITNLSEVQRSLSFGRIYFPAIPRNDGQRKQIGDTTLVARTYETTLPRRFQQ